MCWTLAVSPAWKQRHMITSRVCACVWQVHPPIASLACRYIAVHIVLFSVVQAPCCGHGAISVGLSIPSHLQSARMLQANQLRKPLIQSETRHTHSKQGSRATAESITGPSTDAFAPHSIPVLEGAIRGMETERSECIGRTQAPDMDNGQDWSHGLARWSRAYTCGQE